MKKFYLIHFDIYKGYWTKFNSIKIKIIFIILNLKNCKEKLKNEYFIINIHF